MDIASLSQFAQIIGNLAVVVALCFGAAQIRQFRRQRLDAAASELMRSIQDQQFTRAFRLIYPLPVAVPADDLRALGPEYEDAALALGARFESMGLLVYRESLPMDMVEEIIGGAVVLLWQRLKPWAEANRREQNHPLLFEWFQWLAERLEERGRPSQTPAFERFRDWKPRR
ncbi:hypothetical protein LF41_2945 [Lysobacter dokdonensis DS-58]|uniref:DUF4760 domain-containing protein n=1 Tax=Lysobacter dokdonensis DS-58 TaxID=1300345 RepID=A0A0A2WKP9_9GAMM|nr:hypothetical protein [Lysobacter dokdonensis]KGQ19297.1 hypothetical protein LF41_2945 [Lysobacter dokdonensis DS-58]